MFDLFRAPRPRTSTPPRTAPSARSTALLLLALAAPLVGACGGGGSDSNDDDSGGEDGDTDPPVVSDLEVRVLGSDRVAVEWTTDEPASARVEFGMDENLGDVVDSGSGADTQHLVVLEDLLPSTTYHFLASSEDASENVGWSDPGTFVSGDVDEPDLDGDPVVWHPLSLTFEGPFADEADVDPNPFLDHRLNVELVGPSGQRRRVNGTFAGDGAGGSSGDRWRVRFFTDEAGEWSWTAHFRSGEDIALSVDPNAGVAADPDGTSGRFTVAPRDDSAPGFLKWGQLRWVGDHYLKFKQGPRFIETGLSSPENLFAYAGFDGTVDLGGQPTPGLTDGLHRYAPHVGDWGGGGLGSDDDPNFTGDAGIDAKGLIGALNYLASRGINSVSVQLVNLGGDGQDTWPYRTGGADEEALTHFDLSKLEQWTVVLEHAQRLGIRVRLVLTDDELASAAWLDDSTVGRHRSLFVREMVARFAHLLAVEWCLAEGASLPTDDAMTLAAFVAAADPFDHPIAAASADMAPAGDDEQLDAMLGFPFVQAANLAGPLVNAGLHVERWRGDSGQNALPWVVTHTVQDPVDGGLDGSNAAQFRRAMLWDVLLAGGHVAFYAGPPQSADGDDLTLEDFRTREQMFDQARYARELLEDVGAFWQMEPADELLSGDSGGYGGGEAFASHDEAYVVYLPIADSVASLDLNGASGTFTQRWYNPRSGQYQGGTRTVTGGGIVSLGDAPDAGGGGDGAFLEEGGLVVMEVESAPRVDFWAAETNVPGYTGQRYYRWWEHDYFNQPGVGTLTYEIEVTNPGTYFLAIRNYHDHPEPDRENDCWVRMDGASWHKVFSNLGDQTIGVWNWSSRFDHTGQDARYTLGAGTHQLQISGRSHGYHMDRMHLYLSSVNNPLDETYPESDRGDGGSSGSDKDWVVVLTR